MTQQPKVSIIVNNYNYARFVSEAIESALAQTYPNVEVIVVDDGSTDNSREVIARYQDRVITVLKENGGQGSACNAGFAASSGDRVLFLDSDDLLEPGAMETVVREWRDGYSRIYFTQQIIDAKGVRLEGVVGGSIAPSPLVGPFASGSSMSANVFSRAALEKAMPMPEAWRYTTDYYLNATSLLFGEAWRLGRPLGKYRVHGGNNNTSARRGRLHKARKQVRNDLKLYDSLYRLTGGKIGPIDRWLGTSPHHWVCRIRSLRDSPEDHPWPGDTLPGLTLRAVKAAWRRPGWTFSRRLGYSLYALAYGLLPREFTLLMGKAIPMNRMLATREQREEGDIISRAAEQAREGARA